MLSKELVIGSRYSLEIKNTVSVDESLVRELIQLTRLFYEDYGMIMMLKTYSVRQICNLRFVNRKTIYFRSHCLYLKRTPGFNNRRFCYDKALFLITRRLNILKSKHTKVCKFCFLQYPDPFDYHGRAAFFA